MRTGLFITFEGGEGAGKSTQIQILSEKLRGLGHDVVVTREPGGTPEAEKIRALLVQRDGGDWSPQAECLLLFAARNMHVRDLIAPALARGQTVLCDRFTDSTRAYQGFGLGLDAGVIEDIKRTSIGALEPDLTFVMDIPAETGLRRSTRRLADIASTESRYEAIELAFHERLRAGYLSIAAANPGRCKLIDAAQSVDDVQRDIWHVMEKHR